MGKEGVKGGVVLARLDVIPVRIDTLNGTDYCTRHSHKSTALHSLKSFNIYHHRELTTSRMLHEDGVQTGVVKLQCRVPSNARATFGASNKEDGAGGPVRQHRRDSVNRRLYMLRGN